MAFNVAPYFGGQYVTAHRDRAPIARQLHHYLNLGTRLSCHCIRFEVWARVIGVWVPGCRPTFVSRAAVGV
jgi:hypothetical protein